jgi:hypothetical protein
MTVVAVVPGVAAHASHPLVFSMLAGVASLQVSKRRLIGRAVWAMFGGRFWSERQVLWPLSKLPEEACRQYRLYRDNMVSMRSLDPPRVRAGGRGGGGVSDRCWWRFACSGSWLRSTSTAGLRHESPGMYCCGPWCCCMLLYTHGVVVWGCFGAAAYNLAAGPSVTQHAVVCHAPVCRCALLGSLCHRAASSGWRR